MQPVIKQDASQVDDALAIQIQRRNGGASGGCQPDQGEAIGTPGEMLVPVIAARMKKGNGLFAHWINGMRLVVLFVVTTLTSQREIVSVARAAA